MRVSFTIIMFVATACGSAPGKTGSSSHRSSQESDSVSREARSSVQQANIHSAPAGAAAKGQQLRQPSAAEQQQMYPWPRRTKQYESLASRFAPPKGFTRVALKKGSYEWYLRHLPLLPKGTPVKDYQGNVLTSSTAAAAAVIDLDVGKRDLQQCMDTLMRVRGEYHWWKKSRHRIKFRYGGGKYFSWSQWRDGIRPRRVGRKTIFKKVGAASSSRANFLRYLTFMFAMTGTVNNTRELKVSQLADLRAGDFFLHPAPSATVYGHAVVILDVAKNSSGTVKVLIGEGYTPAQDFHVVKNKGKTIWYDISPAHTVNTPLWPGFTWKNLRRFRY